MNISATKPVPETSGLSPETGERNRHLPAFREYRARGRVTRAVQTALRSAWRIVLIVILLIVIALLVALALLGTAARSTRFTC